MNERIQELAEQAREYATTRHPVSNIILSVNSDLFEQKFAELIVRECVATIANDTANYPGEGMMAYYQGVQDSARAIKKHFGVEE